MEKYPEASVNKKTEKTYKRFTKFYPIRVISSIILLFILMSISSHIEDSLWASLQSNITLRGLVSYILIKCPLALAVFTIGLLPIVKRHRIILGMTLVFALLIDKTFAFLGVSTNSWLSTIVITSDIAFTLFGAILGLLIVTLGKPDSIKREYRQGQGHKTSLFLLLLSLVSVPLTYPFLLIASVVTTIISLLALYVVLQLPRIPVVLIIGIGLAPLVSIWASFKALWAIFFHKPDFQYASKIDMTKQKILETAVNEVCNNVKTKKPDVILLHAEPKFFVMQGTLRTFDGAVKGRILAIGAPLLKQLSFNEFKAVLAHEFAHFSGKDTVYSTYVFPAYKSLGTALKTLEEAFRSDRGSSAYNIMSFFLLMPKVVLGLYLKYFATIDNTLSRGHELRADLVASNFYGSNNMVSALRKVYRVSNHFEDSGYDLALNDKERFFENYEDVLHKEQQKLNDYEEKELQREEGLFDSHPTLGERVKALPVNNVEAADDNTPAMLNELQEQMTKLAETFTDYLRKLNEDYAKFKKIVQEKQTEQIKEGVKEGTIRMAQVRELINKGEYSLALEVVEEIEKAEKGNPEYIFEYKKTCTQAIISQLYQRGGDLVAKNKHKEAKECLDFIRSSIMQTPEFFHLDGVQLQKFIDEIKNSFCDETCMKDLKGIRDKLFSRANEMFKDDIAKHTAQMLADAIILPLAYGTTDETKS